MVTPIFLEKNMIYRYYGKTGKKVSLLGFGGMRFTEDREESLKAVKRAAELGINYFDTAPTYCNSTSEGIIGEATTYPLGVNDVVQIDVRNQPEFSGQYIVDPEGKIQYKFVGDIQAEGLTKDELQVVLVDKLKQFVKQPEVSVMIVAYQSKNIYVFGAVNKPGKYSLRGETISLRDALVDAGLPTDAAALRRTYVIKPHRYTPSYKKVDLVKLLFEGKLQQNLDLVAGDLVVVPTTVPSEINKALSNLLSPFFKAESLDAAIQRHN